MSSFKRVKTFIVLIAVLLTIHFFGEEKVHNNSSLLFYKKMERVFQESLMLNDSQKYFEPVDPVRQKDINNILNMSLNMNVKPLLLTLVNNAFLPFLYSWLCNTNKMGIHRQVLVISTDISTKKSIHMFWPDIHVTAMSMDYVKAQQDFGRPGYVRLMIRRTQILLALLKHGIETFLFEADCLWIKNPIPYTSLFRGNDIVFGKANRHNIEIAGGIMHIFPINATVEVFKQLSKMLKTLEIKTQFQDSTASVPEDDNEQAYMSFLVYEKFGGLKPVIIPATHFVNGMWYKMGRTERQKMNPYIINNNYIVGNDKKISRAKSLGHWFITDDNACDLNQVDEIVSIW